MSTKLDAGLRRLEAKAKAKASPAQAEQMTLPEAIGYMLDGMRGGGLVFKDGQWCARFIDCEPLTPWLNELRTAQAGAVIVPLWPREFIAAIAAMDAGRFRLARTDYMQYHWQNEDARTGTPILDSSTYQDNEACDLARAVHTACYHVFCQGGAAMPLTLEDFAAWLRTWQPYALPAELDLDHAQS